MCDGNFAATHADSGKTQKGPRDHGIWKPLMEEAILRGFWMQTHSMTTT